MAERTHDFYTHVDTDNLHNDSHYPNKDIQTLVHQTDKAKLMNACMNINLDKKTK